MRLLLSFLLFSFFFENQIQARFADFSDAAFEIESFNRFIEVDKKGAFTELIEVKVKILNDSGKNNLATQPLYYDETTQKLTIIEAQTMDQNQVHQVGSKFIEDKPIASHHQGFSSYRQVLVAFPHIHVGTEVYLKYKLVQKEAYLPKTFFTDFVYGQKGYWRSSKVTLTSEIPFKIAINDPESFLNVQSKIEKQKQFLEITLKKPLTKEIVDEPEVLLDTKALPWVSVSSISEWKTLIEKITPEYERILAQPLPELLQKISAQAGKEPDLFKKINHVTSALIDELHYMGDWRSISGRIYPNDFKKITESRRGDCKDFATVTTAILRKLGVNAHVALVRRGGYFDAPNALATINAFNHAIVRVQSQNQIIWIDPTHFVSFAPQLFSDISNRLALPLLPNAQEREKIPNTLPQDSQILLSAEIHFFKKNRTHVKASLTQKGASAIGLTGATLRVSKENINFQIIHFFDDSSQISSWNFKPYELDSRIVKDTTLEFEYEKRTSELKTTQGPGYLVSSSKIISQFLTRVQDRVSDLLILDEPTIFKKTILLKKTEIAGNTPLNCKIRSPWIDASRFVSHNKEGVKIQDTTLVKQSLIPAHEHQTSAYASLQQELENCFSHIAVILKAPSME